MSRWDIHVDAVRAVLKNTGDVAGEFKGEFTAYGDAVESASKSAGTMLPGCKPKDGTPGPVGAALGEFASRMMKDLEFLPARSAESIEGAALAAMAYDVGDLQMAATAQQETLKAPDAAHLDKVAERLMGKGGQAE
ncbi:DUF6507 family protein [Streptomyces silvisoli]|uniref:DUF6507 family protein n=1 Tax=Streptomyces silvisoli TaxID=3034235 RepID=A0ABT5ZJW0_9ACTN|nr:DUF6507 family protein [Streptomyces silvisoli]MDF3290115.1 DUF6507 family protein [Streptomyces silvisoli]